MTLILRRDVASARLRRNDIIALREAAFCVFASTEIARDRRAREKERRNRRDGASALFGARLFRDSFKILLSNSARYFVVGGKGFSNDKEKEEEERKGEKESEEEGFHRMPFTVFVI